MLYWYKMTNTDAEGAARGGMHDSPVYLLYWYKMKILTQKALLGEACTTLQFLWSGAVEAMGIMGILRALVGKAALPGLGVVLILLPVQVRRVLALLVHQYQH